MSLAPIGCPETSVRNYQHLLRNNPEQRSSQLLRGGSLNSRIDLHSMNDNHMNGNWQRKPVADWRNKICCKACECTWNLVNIPKPPGSSRYLVLNLIPRVTNPPLLRFKYCCTNARDFVNEIHTWNCSQVCFCIKCEVARNVKHVTLFNARQWTAALYTVWSWPIHTQVHFHLKPREASPITKCEYRKQKCHKSHWGFICRIQQHPPFVPPVKSLLGAKL